MPTYEYACTSCNHEWEAEQSIKDAALTECPTCHNQTARRQISRGTGFILKGSGWYSDLYSSSSNKKPESSGDKGGGDKGSGDKGSGDKGGGDKGGGDKGSGDKGGGGDKGSSGSGDGGAGTSGGASSSGSSTPATPASSSTAAA